MMQSCGQSHRGAFVDTTRVTDLVFADDAIFPAESMEALAMALGALLEETN